MIVNGWQVPDVVIGASIAAAIALIAAALTFIGVLVSNRHARMRLQVQLDHDARQSDRKRRMELRRDVYLAATEAIMGGTAVVSRLADIRSDETELQRELLAAAAIVAKAHVVANEKTVTALVRFQSFLMKSYLELSTLRIPLKLNLSELDRLTGEIANERNEASRWVELMKQADITQKSNHDLVARHTEVSTAHIQGLISYGKQATDRTLALSRLLPDALLAARSELELPIDEAEYRALSESVALEAKLAIDDVLERLSELTRK